MNTQGTLAHTHRQGILSDTRSELPLDRTYLPPDWQADDRSDRRRVWGVILACAVGVVSLLLLLDANRAALYGVSHPQAVEISDAVAR